MPNKINVDLLGHGKGQGPVAHHILTNGRMDPGMLRPFVDLRTGKSYVTVYNGGDPKNPASYISREIRTNATLRREEWMALDEALLTAVRYRLGGIQDLIDEGLIYNLGNAMGTTVLEYHDVNDAMEADLTMDGITRSKGDRADFGVHYLPIPILHADFEINARALAASRALGNPLDTIQVEMGGRRILEKLENMLFTDTTYAFGGGTINSYVNITQRNKVTLSANWDASGKTGVQIVADVLKMVQASIDAKYFGPWNLYVPTGYQTVLDADYDATTPGTTIRERILKIDGIKKLKVIDSLAANNVLLVQMTPDVVRLVRGMGLQVVEWESEGKFVTNFKVMTIQVPQVRADYNGACGITHLAGSF